MFRSFLVLSLLIFVTAVPALISEELGESAQLTKLTERYLYAMFEQDPVYATQMGEYAPESLRYPDYSRKAQRALASEVKDLRRELRKIDQSQLTANGKIDAMLLDGELQTRLLLLEGTNLQQDNPKAYSSAALNGIYFLLISPSFEDSAKARMILERIFDLPRFLASSREELKAPPKVWILLAEQEAETGLDFFAEVADFVAEQLPDRRNEIESAFTAANTALEGFSDFLDALKLENEKSFAIGVADFNALLKEQHFLDFDADSLLQLGEWLFEDALERRDSLAAIVETLTVESPTEYFVPQSFGPDDVLDYFQWEIDQTSDWLQRHGFVTVPQGIGACIPMETPRFLRNIIGGIAYQPPGPFERVQTGRFYVRPLPDTLDESSRAAWFRYCMQRGFKGSIVHEAYPGHHLQIELSNRNPSLIRRIVYNTVMMEGWALYCEEAMYEQGFYGDDPRRQLSIQDGVVFRAARVIVDVRLQTGDWTYSEAVGWMIDNLGSSLEYVETEVGRYTLSPTQPMSYLIGKLQILEIRDLYRKQLGDAYSPAAFHDMLLAEGSIPPALILKKLKKEL
ncbi:MAG: DUF885 domain-containing protein [bacterium]